MSKSPTAKAKYAQRQASLAQLKERKRAEQLAVEAKERAASVAHYFKRRAGYSDTADELRRMAKDLNCEHLLPDHLKG